MKLQSYTYTKNLSRCINTQSEFSINDTFKNPPTQTNASPFSPLTPRHPSFQTSRIPRLAQPSGLAKKAGRAREERVFPARACGAVDLALARLSAAVNRKRPGLSLLPFVLHTHRPPPSRPCYTPESGTRAHRRDRVSRPFSPTRARARGKG